MEVKENTLEEFQAVAQPVMEWLKENGHLHNTAVITPYYAKVTSDEIGVVDTETEEVQ